MAHTFNIVFCDNTDINIKKSIDYLVERGFKVSLIKDEKALFEFINKEVAHVILLELDYRSKDAISLTSEIRNQKGINQPFIIIYSEKHDDFIQVTALNAGADDYIVSPLKPLLLEARISALTKRYDYKQIAEKEEESKRFLVDKDRYLIVTERGKLNLPRKEFEMVHLMYSNSNKIFTRQDFAQIIWNNLDVANKRTIDIHIRNIRRLLGEDVIKTIKGVGYRFNDALY
ncbi:MAG: response regulator transcription factor [Bacteroidetes bacterium]|nr:response regulator transcription factor [Bacteroidota bacterium]